MASWSLETVVRLHGLMSWLAILAAAVAVACGIFAYILSNQASALRERAAQQPDRQAAEVRAEFEHQASQSEQLQLQLEQEVESLQASLEESRQQAWQFEEEAEAARQERDAQSRRAQAALDAASQQEAELRDALAELDKLKAAQAAKAAQGPFGEHQRSKLLRALSGKPSGEVTLVSVAGDEPSLNLAKGLEETLRQAGWQVILREGQFPSKPDGLYFVVHSQETMPEYTLQLAVGLAVIDLMPIPAKMRVNPEKPPGSLGLVIGSVNP